MIVKLTPDNIVQHWDMIKWASNTVAQTPHDQIEKASLGLLVNLLKNDYQCWMVVSEDRKVKTLLVTKIYLDVFGIRHILIETAYGFSPASNDDKADFIDEIERFGINQGMKGGTISALTSNNMAANAMRKMNMDEAYRIFSKKIGG